MKSHTDFPPADEARIRATAWALSQLTPEETTAFESEMAANAELAAYAEEMRQFSGLLSAQFPAIGETGQLAEASRDRVVVALSETAPRPLPQSFFKRHWKGLSITTAAAAGIVLTLRPDWIPPTLQFAEVPQSSPSRGSKLVTEADFKAAVGEMRVLEEKLNKTDSIKAKVAYDNQLAQLNDVRQLFLKQQVNELLPTSDDASAVRLRNPAPAQPPKLPQLSLANTSGGMMGAGGDYDYSRSDGLKDSEVRLNIHQIREATRLAGIAPPRGSYDPTETGYFDSGTGRALDGTYTQANTESYKNLPTNHFLEVTAAPLSTFSIDVDTASYANVRRFLNEGQRPPAAAVRLEELVNYFPYEDAPPQDGKPFAVRVETTAAPWNPAHRLTRIALKGSEIATAQRPSSNLVFLVDVSGSMNEPNKLPLVQQSLRMLTERLTENDRVSLVTYAGSTAVVLPSTNGQEKPRILSAIDSLSSGGSTNGAGGLELAYQQAAAHFIKDGVNRVILATDGDFNVGISSRDALLAFIETKAKTGVFLSVLGYGRGNLKDDTMELLADKGNGNYGYIDSLSEARKTLVEQMSGTLVTIAKDVKIQIEFNPAAVKSYRLLGYENRMLAKEDFNNDKKDAGEIGAGHNVTALYEIVTAGAPGANPIPVVDGLKYQQVPAVTAPKPEPTPAALTGEMMTVKLRWKQPQADTSELLELPVKDTVTPLDQAGQETRWSAAVAGFAQLLRGEAPPALTWEMVRQLARTAKGQDALGYRGEFLQLIDKAEGLTR